MTHPYATNDAKAPETRGPYAVVAYPEPHLDTAVRDIWERLASRGVTSYLLTIDAAPHLTIAVYDELEVSFAAEKLRAIAAATPPIELQFCNLGAFTTREGVVYLGATVTPSLLELHRRVHEAIAEGGWQAWAHYQPGHWIPHCTLARHLTEDQIPEAIAVGQELTLPVTAHLTSLGLVTVEPLEYLGRFPLAGPPESDRVPSAPV